MIGIVGGIGAGKSTVAARFADCGCAVISADEIAGEFLEAEHVRAQIRNQIGAGVFRGEGQVDRKKLADVVFNNGEKLARLNSIIHPPVLQRCEELISRYQADERYSGIVLDMPLLIEVGWQSRCDAVIFVRCDKKKRLARLKNEGFFGGKQVSNEKYLDRREKFQISLDKKAAIANYIIDNNSDPPALTKQVSRVFSCILYPSG